MITQGWFHWNLKSITKMIYWILFQNSFLWQIILIHCIFLLWSLHQYSSKIEYQVYSFYIFSIYANGNWKNKKFYLCSWSAIIKSYVNLVWKMKCFIFVLWSAVIKSWLFFLVNIFSSVLVDPAKLKNAYLFALLHHRVIPLKNDREISMLE